VRRSPAQTLAASFPLCGTERSLRAHNMPKRGFHDIRARSWGHRINVLQKHAIENIISSRYVTHSRDVLFVFCLGT
jgi:hypothetical protein